MANIALEKNGHVYLFRYDPNNLDKLWLALMELVNDETQDFNFFDADALSYAVCHKE